MKVYSEMICNDYVNYQCVVHATEVQGPETAFSLVSAFIHKHLPSNLNVVLFEYDVT